MTVERIVDAEGLAKELARFVEAVHGIALAGGPPADRGAPPTVRDEPTRAALAALCGIVDTDAGAATWDAALEAPPVARPAGLGSRRPVAGETCCFATGASSRSSTGKA